MNIRNTWQTSFFVVFLLLAGGLHAYSQDSEYVTEKVAVEGLIDHPFTITPGNVMEFKVQRITEPVAITGASGEVKRTIRSFEGILLRDLIDSAGVKMPDKKDRGEYIVEITASDGYRVVFAWNELYYGPAGKNTWLLFKENGQPITKDGRFIILCASDLVTGPRHVKWVEKITVRRVD